MFSHDVGRAGMVALRKILSAAFRSSPGRLLLSLVVTATQYRVFAPRTTRLMRFDLARLGAAVSQRSVSRVPHAPRLHLGCGTRKIEGCLNVDAVAGECLADLAGGRLPWDDDTFACIVGQHVVEHLELDEELLPVLRERRRMSKAWATLGVSCPDLEKICRLYLADPGRSLIQDRETRPHGNLGLDGPPPQHIIDAIFHQSGEHKNLFDFELLAWALRRPGFSQVVRVRSRIFSTALPELLARHDDYHSLYARAVAP